MPRSGSGARPSTNTTALARRTGFSRPARDLDDPHRPAPYCIPVYPGGATTNGGPRRDEHARILNPFREPIEGLFGAGELGGAIGMLYPSPGANLGEAFAFGVIAAETALAASPFSGREGMVPETDQVAGRHTAGGPVAAR